MAENEPPNMDQIGKKRTFTTITTTANNLIKKVKGVVEDEKLPVLVEGLEAATKEYLSIMLEKLDVAEIMTHSPKAKFLYELDLAKLFAPETKEVEKVKAVQIDVLEVKAMFQGMDLNEKPTNLVSMDSFKRLQDKVQDHGVWLKKFKNQEPPRLEDSSPKDMAQKSFYEFVKSPMGFGLYQMLSLDVLPGQEDWELHRQWWDDNAKKLQTKLNKRGAFDEYHEFVAWRSQLFMNKYWEMVSKAITNLTVNKLEQLMWDAQLLRSIILELGLTKETANEKRRTKLQRIIALPTKLLDSKGDFEKVRIAINGVLPSSIGDWWCITMDKKELIKFKGHQLQPLLGEEQMVVPHFKGLVKDYRASFPLMEPQLTKQVNRVIKKPEMDNLKEIFGTDSEDEPVPKKKNKKTSSKRKKRAPTPESDDVSPDEVEEGDVLIDSASELSE